MSSIGEISEAEQERLQAVIDSSPVAPVTFGLDTRMRVWNPAAERLRPAAEEMLGRAGLPLAPPAKRARERGAVRAGSRSLRLADDARFRPGGVGRR